MFIFIFMLQFGFNFLVFFLFSVLVMIFFDTLLDFSASIFFLPYHVSISFVFSDPANNFFQYFSSPLHKNNGPSLDLSGAPAG